MAGPHGRTAAAGAGGGSTGLASSLDGALSWR